MMGKTLIVVTLGMVLAMTGVTLAQAQEAEAPAPALDAGTPPGAPGAPQAGETDEPLDVLGQIVQAARSGNWRLVASGALVLVMFCLRRFRDRVTWFGTSRGGATLAMGLALAGAFASALATSAPIDWRLVTGAIGVAFTGVGGYHWFRRVLGIES